MEFGNRVESQSSGCAMGNQAVCQSISHSLLQAPSPLSETPPPESDEDYSRAEKSPRKALRTSLLCGLIADKFLLRISLSGRTPNIACICDVRFVADVLD